jgi:hypothetical protein
MLTTVLVVIAAISYASSLTIPYTFTSGATISASQMNANFQAVKTASDDNYNRIVTLEGKMNKLGTIMASTSTYPDYCDSTLNAWNECAAITVTIPAGKTAKVLVMSSASFPNTSTSPIRSAMCITSRLSSAAAPGACGSGLVGTITQPNSDMNSASISGILTLSAGTYVVSTGILPNGSYGIISGFDYGRVSTSVLVVDSTAIYGTLDEEAKEGSLTTMEGYSVSAPSPAIR